MLNSFFFVSAIGSIIHNISAKRKLKKLSEANGWNNPNYNRYLQEQIFDKYLWNVGRCSEQEFMTTWELYQLAQTELTRQGFKWNPAWNRYTPQKNSVEYVRGTQIYNNLLNSEYHRYGEDLEYQDEIFKKTLIGQDMYKNALERDDDGYTQYEAYLYLKTINNSPLCNTPLFDNIDYEDGIHYNEYGEPFHWYDDLMPFTPSRTYIPYPCEKTLALYRSKGIDLTEIQRQMQKSVIDSYPQRKRALNERNEKINTVRKNIK